MNRQERQLLQAAQALRGQFHRWRAKIESEARYHPSVGKTFKL